MPTGPMKNQNMEPRITDIEIRLSHQEAALDELTRTSLQHQQAIKDILSELQQIKIMLQQLSPGMGNSASDETPPHY